MNPQPNKPQPDTTNTELTPEQAAELLNVTQPYIQDLLNQGTIKHHTTNNQPRIKTETLINYKNDDDKQRQTTADELTQLNQEMGLI